MKESEFRKLYNQRVAQLKAHEGIEILGVVSADGDAVVMNTRTPGVNLRYFDKEQAYGAIVSGRMGNKQEVMAAFLAYAICIDIISGKSEKARNKLMERMHLFDGKLGPKGSNRSQGDCIFEVQPHQPERGMISYSAVKTRPESAPVQESP